MDIATPSEGVSPVLTIFLFIFLLLGAIGLFIFQENQKRAGVAAAEKVPKSRKQTAADASVTAVVRSIDQLSHSRVCCVAAPFFCFHLVQKKKLSKKKMAREARENRSQFSCQSSSSISLHVQRGAVHRWPSALETNTHAPGPVPCLSVSTTAPACCCCQQWSKHAAGSGAEGSLGPCSSSNSRPLPFEIFCGSSIVASIHSILPQLPF